MLCENQSSFMCVTQKDAIMRLKEYLKLLTPMERRELAAEIRTTDTYLRKIMCFKQDIASISFFAAVVRSDFNARLPKSIQLKETTLTAYRKSRLAKNLK